MIFIDVESRSSRDIIKCGAHAYAEVATMMCAVWFDTDTEQFTEWRIGDPTPTQLSGKHMCAHNSAFEEAILRHCWGIEASEWSDTMAMAAVKSLPLKLEKLGTALGIIKEKDMVGAKMMKKICVPIKGTQEEYQDYTEEDYEVLVAYCKRDVEATVEIYSMLPKLIPQEHRQYQLHLAINNGGVPLDYTLIDAAIECADLICTLVAANTGYEESFFRSTQQMTAKLNELGIPMSKLTKAEVDKVLTSIEGDDKYDEARGLLKARQQIGQSSIAKFEKMRTCSCKDGRVRGLLFFFAGLTGRFGGRQFQIQNLPRPAFDPDVLLPLILAKDIEGIMKATNGDPMGGVASCIRAAIHGDFICADWSNIEGRLAAWCAGEEWKLQAFRDFDEGTGPDLYKLAYSKSFNKDIELVTKDDRQVGKVQELALQYGGSNGAFDSMAANFGVFLPEDEVTNTVQGWRKANKAIVKFWDILGDNAAACVQNKGDNMVYTAGPVKMMMKANDLVLKLPSGRHIYYTDAKWEYITKTINEKTFSCWCITCMRTTNGNQWLRADVWKGLLFENVVQAMAADILRFAIKNLALANYKILFHVHDEILCEGGDLEEMSKIMCREHENYKGLPLAAEGWEGSRFRK